MTILDVLYEAEFTLGDSTYHALHDTLRDYMFSTAKLTTPSIAPNALGVNESAKRQADSILSDSTLSNIGQTRLLRNYVDEIASWLDMFDNRRTLQYYFLACLLSAKHFTTPCLQYHHAKWNE
ncbi:hypothetical protein V1527DRAFT_515445 [Lipomyces starkeyi]